MATSVRLSLEAERRLDFLAAQTGRTKAYYLREMIERARQDIKAFQGTAYLTGIPQVPPPSPGNGSNTAREVPMRGRDLAAGSGLQFKTDFDSSCEAPRTGNAVVWDSVQLVGRNI